MTLGVSEAFFCGEGIVGQAVQCPAIYLWGRGARSEGGADLDS